MPKIGPIEVLYNGYVNMVRGAGGVDPLFEKILKAGFYAGAAAVVQIIVEDDESSTNTAQIRHELNIYATGCMAESAIKKAKG